MTSDNEATELRRIISQCAEATGAFVAPTASLGFMAKLPDEIRLGRDRLTREKDEAAARIETLERALERIAWHPIENPIAGRPSLGVPPYPSCQDIARAALSPSTNGTEK